MRQVIKEIETRSSVELLAIGIGHDVTRYYRRAVTVTDAEELAGVMTDKLAELFDEDLARRRLHRAAPATARATAAKRRKLTSVPSPVVARSWHRLVLAGLAVLAIGPGPCRQAGERARERAAGDNHRHPYRFRSRSPGAQIVRQAPVSGRAQPLRQHPSYFGGYSALAIDPSGTALLAISDAGSWLRANIDYDGRKLKGLSGAVLGPLLGKDGKPLSEDAEREFRRHDAVERQRRQRRRRYLLRARPPHLALSLHRLALRPAGRRRAPAPDSRKMDANRGLEALAEIHTGKLKGTLVAFSERLLDKNGNLKGWLISGPTPGPIALKRLEGFDITDVAPLPEGGIVVLEPKISLQRGRQDAHPPHRRGPNSSPAS